MPLVKDGAGIRIEGLAELDAALGQLPKTMARSTLRRVLKRAGEPIAETARQLCPVSDIDHKHLRDTIAVSPRIKNNVGKAEFARAMRAGLGNEAAVAALRGARRAAAGQGSFAAMYVGPGPMPHAHLVEFGSIHNAPQPFMRPAWDQKKGEALEIIKRDLWTEIEKSANRYANKLLKSMKG